jgi:Tfp pilus assembly protein PilN
VVFSTPKNANLRSFIARLERYWLLRRKETQLPRKIYLINDSPSFSDLKEFSEQLNLSKNFDIPEIKAIGLALCSDSSVPLFAGASEKSRFRHFRVVAYFTSIALLLCCCILLSGIIGLRYYYNSRIGKCENEYRELLTNNKDFRELLNSGSQLSKKLLRMEKFSSNRTQWSRFLHELGSQKIQGLYYEQLGCDAGDSKGVIKIALTGWAESEKVVTEMIKRMNTSGMFKNIQLTSLDKDDIQKERCRFKFICSVNFSTK